MNCEPCTGAHLPASQYAAFLFTGREEPRRQELYPEAKWNCLHRKYSQTLGQTKEKTNAPPFSLPSVSLPYCSRAEAGCIRTTSRSTGTAFPQFWEICPMEELMSIHTFLTWLLSDGKPTVTMGTFNQCNQDRNM